MSGTSVTDSDDSVQPPERRYYPARPTVYKGIRMRSRLEAAWAAHFDSNNCEWEYEPFCFASEAGQYLPDFRSRPRREEGDGVWIWQYSEVKGVLDDPSYWMAKMEIILATDPTAFLEILHGSPETVECWVTEPIGIGGSRVWTDPDGHIVRLVAEDA